MGFKDRKQKWFADDYTPFSIVYNDHTRQEKVGLFELLKKQKSKIPEMIAENSLRIVELGAGSGPNLEYYPQNCHLTVIDPNKHFEPHFMKTLEQHPGILLDDYVSTYSENMREYVKDESVDAVVVTSVGCSVKDVQQYYKEIQRILVPGGKFYYLEHILGQRGSWTYFKQMILTGTRIWPAINCNCHLNRKLDFEITKAGFSNIDQRLFTIKSGNVYLRLVSPHVIGVATK